MNRLALCSLIVFVLIADQGAKHFARNHLAFKRPQRYGILIFLYAENQGAFLDLGSTLEPRIRVALFDGGVAAGLIIAAIVLFRGTMRRGDSIALALIVAGGLGNLIDRLRFAGRVSDFLYLGIGALHTGIFNVADMAITVGVIWLIIAWSRPSRPADSLSPPTP